MATIKEYSTDYFQWGEESRTFYSDASTLSRGEFMSRLYDDACDEGFRLISARTAVNQIVYLVDAQSNWSGDIIKWTFKPLDKGCDFSVVVYNT